MAGGAGSAHGPVGLVLAGGGARGAYELGALAALLPTLEARRERPRVIVGTSVGAINVVFLAAMADRPVDEVVARGAEVWTSMGFDDMLARIVPFDAIERNVAGPQLRAAAVVSTSARSPAPHSCCKRCSSTRDAHAARSASVGDSRVARTAG